jgi:hypothetical protein
MYEFADIDASNYGIAAVFGWFSGRFLAVRMQARVGRSIASVVLFLMNL